MARAQVLSRRQLRELEAELLSERKRLERFMDVDAYMDESLANGEGGATTLTEIGVEGGVQARTHTRYDAIVNALDRLAAGTYGTCMACDRPIPYGRLIVMPEAPHCIACSSRA
ncbi:MAG TPA: TraR/DksA C4-type zinc finger protein [Gemmatimonadaceae bacterium]|nr:TraR/DksA C4-type zinc finger protein [Gemmatimonadaceae bacterium]